MKTFLRFTIFTPLVAAFASVWANPAYVVRDLGTLGDASYARAVNNAGQVAGTYLIDGVSRAFLSSDGQLTDLGVPAGSNASAAYAINAQGDVVGSATTAAGTFHAVLFSQGGIVELGTLDRAPFDSSIATAINDVGVITGVATVDRSGRPVNHGFVYANGSLRDVGMPPAPYQSEPTFMPRAINAAGDIVGSAVSPDGLGDRLAFYSTQGGSWVTIPTTPFSSVSATAINGRGAVAGFYAASEHSHGFVVVNGQSMDLGLLADFTDLQPNAINGEGIVVGRASETTNGRTTAFVYISGALYDLNRDVTRSGDEFASLTEATAINDRGQIAGFGTTAGGETHAFLLTPLARPAREGARSPLE